MITILSILLIAGQPCIASTESAPIDHSGNSKLPSVYDPLAEKHSQESVTRMQDLQTAQIIPPTEKKRRKIDIDKILY
ncbi:MAG: hypothetical protein KC649_06570 [Candidatus Omnitrophica bacterium]|nr:hypothetical protein [Candidatus Omnitrophota bacterium]